MRQRAWTWFLAAGGLVTAVHVTLADGLVRDLVYIAVAFATLVAVLVGVRLHRPARPLPWYLLAGGIAAWASGDVVWAYVAFVLEQDPFPSAADAFYLGGYVLLAAALLTLVPRRVGLRDHAAVLDSLIAGVSVTAVLWSLLVRPVWGAPAGGLERMVALAYPVADVVLVGYLVHLAFSRLRRTPTFWMIGVAFVLTLVGDVMFQAIDVLPQFDDIRAVEPFWLAGYLLWGAAALHPSMRGAHRLQEREVSTDTPGRIAVILAAAGVLPVVSLIERNAELERSPVTSILAMLIVVLVGLRMTLMVRRLQSQATHLAHLAERDFLTGLLNRRRFVDHLAHATREVRNGSAARPVVIAVGLERFTEINDTLGHRIGDELLRAIAARLRESACPEARHSRLGGDVFGVLVPDAPDLEETRRRAADLARALHEPFLVSDLGVDVEVSVGLVRAPDHGVDPAELLHRVDVALMAARTAPGRVAVYEPAMEAGGALAPELMAELGDALEAGELHVHYQPQVDLATGRVVGAEALVRWQHPRHGLLGPAAFVTAAERTGQIRALTRHVLDAALTECAAWRAEGRCMSVAVNLSVRNLLDPRLVEDVREALDRHDVPATSLELEITETSAMVDPERSGQALRALDSLGVQLAIDDYGTGYGSLAYLQNLPIRRLKIDRSFVARLGQDGASRAIVRSVLDLSGRLGLEVVAEGVEDDATLLLLRDMGCEVAQGFGLGRPSPGPALRQLVSRIEDTLPTVLDTAASRGVGTSVRL